MPTPAALRTRTFLVCAAVVLAGGAAATTVALTDDQPGQALTPLTGTSTEPGSPSAEPGSPSAEPSAPAGQATASPSPAPTQTSGPTPSPRASTSPRSYPFPRPTTTYPPLTVTTVLSPAADGTTQTSYTLSVRLKDGDGSGYVARVEWGDGTSWVHSPIPIASCSIRSQPTEPPAPYSPSPSDVTITMHHAWRVAGNYTVAVSANSGGNSCDPSAPAAERVTRSFAVQVADDETVTSNGPAAPDFLDISAQQNPSSHSFDLSGHSADSDGFVTRVDVDWGDGSAHGIFTRPMSDCRDRSGAAYPNDQEWMVRPYFSHTYKKAGTFALTITVTSVGCDGADTQTSLTKGTAKV